MKKYALVLCATLPLLGGCNSTVLTIGQVAANSLPAACAIYAVAKGYFANVLAANSSNNISIGNAANAIAAGICPPNPPPTNIRKPAAWWGCSKASTHFPSR